jgi:hypothetical protein
MEIAGQVRALLSPLSALQHRLLVLLGWSTGIYERLIRHFQKPALILREPCVFYKRNRETPEPPII